MQLNPNDVHVWSIDILAQSEHEKNLLALLSPDEMSRAKRFRLLQHRKQFIAARGTLRQLLSLYLEIPAAEIELAYTVNNKPYLVTSKNSSLQFNLAHSHDKAVYAFTLQHAIGIDIEKIKLTCNPAIAKRYFSSEENAYLMNLPKQVYSAAFYRIWSRKEAIAKAIGKGLSFPFASFTVIPSDVSKTVIINNTSWTLLPLSIHSDYACALASNQNIKAVSYWHLTKDGHKIIKQSVD